MRSDEYGGICVNGPMAGKRVIKSHKSFRCVPLRNISLSGETPPQDADDFWYEHITFHFGNDYMPRAPMTVMGFWIPQERDEKHPRLYVMRELCKVYGQAHFEDDGQSNEQQHVR